MAALACGEEDAGLDVVLRRLLRVREQLEVVVDEALVALVLERPVIELRREGEAAAPAGASEQGEECDAGALVGGSGEDAVGAEIAAGRGLNGEHGARGVGVGEGVGGVDEVIDAGVWRRSANPRPLVATVMVTLGRACLMAS